MEESITMDLSDIVSSENVEQVVEEPEEEVASEAVEEEE